MVLQRPIELAGFIGQLRSSQNHMSGNVTCRELTGLLFPPQLQNSFYCQWDAENTENY